ncbi:MAG: hypothetical protein JSR98_06495, partial [Proteobacteria bacterium]|nr:hypothetical protein [Pseudomonadota bacterium]
RGASTTQLGLVQLKATGDIHINQGLIASDAFSSSPGGLISISGANVTLDNGAKVESNSAGQGAGGQIQIKATGTLHVANLSSVSSDAQFLGDAGDVALTGQTVTIDGGSLISSDTLSAARSGAVTVSAGTLNVTGQAAISSSTFGDGPAGNVTATADTLTVDQGGAIVSEALPFSTGHAGIVSVNGGAVKVANDGLISTTTAGAGDAGAVSLTAKSLVIDNGEVSSGSVSGATGASGSLAINTGSLSVTNGGVVTTLSNNTHAAGQIAVTAGDVRISGAGSAISSENQAGNRAFGNRRGQAGDAGSIQLNASLITVADGGTISTNSFAGAAGQIGISIKTPGMLVLQGVGAPGTIQTSSGPGTGGKITIDEPLAVVSNGGSILALGQLNGANVDIDSKYFINSTDRVNTIEVAGEIHLQAGLYDVSSGTISHDVSVLDASKVLRGQCPAVRAVGATSQLVTRPLGPYVRPISPDAAKGAPEPGKPATPGDCR